MITAMLMAAALAADTPPADSFCRRMAAELNMKLDPKKVPQRRVYVASTFTLRQHIFGGNVAVMLAIKMPEDADMDDVRAVSGMCKLSKGGAECRPRVGVAQYVQLSPEREFVLPLREGETPRVFSNGGSIECEDTPPA